MVVVRVHKGGAPGHIIFTIFKYAGAVSDTVVSKGELALLHSSWTANSKAVILDGTCFEKKYKKMWNMKLEGDCEQKC